MAVFPLGELLTVIMSPLVGISSIIVTPPHRSSLQRDVGIDRDWSSPMVGPVWNHNSVAALRVTERSLHAT
jgi:hypothetical protein